MNVTKCPLIKNIKLQLIQTYKNCPKMLDSFLFNILGTRSNKLSGLTDWIYSHVKNKSVTSYHL